MCRLPVVIFSALFLIPLLRPLVCLGIYRQPCRPPGSGSSDPCHLPVQGGPRDRNQAGQSETEDFRGIPRKGGSAFLADGELSGKRPVLRAPSRRPTGNAA